MRSRIRSIKPDVHLDEVLWDLEVETGLPIFRAFVGLWNFSDREGRFEWRPRALKSGILPYWDGDFSRVLHALTTRAFVVKYTCDGRDYGYVRTFGKHQLVNNREEPSKLPAPPPFVPEPPDITPESTREARVGDASSTLHVPAQVDWEGIGNGNGKGSGASSTRAADDGDAALFEPGHTEPTDAGSRGRAWLRDVCGLDDWDHRGRWRHALVELSAKPVAELERAAGVLLADGKKLDIRAMLTPSHVLDQWPKYGAGKAPGPKRAPAPAELREEQTTRGKLVRGYARRHRTKRGEWTAEAENVSELDSLAAQVERHAAADGLQPGQVITAMLDEFFSDELMAKRGWPLAFLAKNPDEWLSRNHAVRDVRATRAQQLQAEERVA